MATKKVEASSAERRLIDRMFIAYHELQKLGWRETLYAPSDTPLELIEAGSTGIHEGVRNGDGSFWIYDGESLPSKPILFRSRVAVASEREERTHG